MDEYTYYNYRPTTDNTNRFTTTDNTYYNNRAYYTSINDWLLRHSKIICTSPLNKIVKLPDYLFEMEL